MKLLNRLLPDSLFKNGRRHSYLNEQSQQYPETAIQALLAEEKWLFTEQVPQAFHYALAMDSNSKEKDTAPTKKKKNLEDLPQLGQYKLDILNPACAQILNYAVELEASLSLTPQQIRAISDIKQLTREIQKIVRHLITLQN